MSGQYTTQGQYGLIYRLLFFYLEPFFALGGTYLCHFNPSSYFSKVLPGNIDPILPNTQLILTNLASSYLHFAIIEAVTLRLTNDKRVWISVIVAMLANDLGHLWSLWRIRREMEVGFAWDFGSAVDWQTFGPTYLPLVLRLAFLAGWDGWTGTGEEKVKAK